MIDKLFPALSIHLLACIVLLSTANAQNAAASQTASPPAQGVAADDEEVPNNGEDVTRPINRFDLRMQYQSLPDGTSSSGSTLDDRSQETLTLRSDLVFFQKPDQFALRVDLPFVWTNKTSSSNPDGNMKSGVGDLLTQMVYAHTINSRWAVGVGGRMYFPTDSGSAFGNGKWVAAPLAGFRCFVPEISKGTYTGFVVRWHASFAGNPSTSPVRNVVFSPQLNISLPDAWYLNSTPEIQWNYTTGKWFVPMYLMVGKKFGERWVTSLEYRHSFVNGTNSYNNWVEARIGYFF